MIAHRLVITEVVTVNEQSEAEELLTAIDRAGEWLAFPERTGSVRARRRSSSHSRVWRSSGPMGDERGRRKRGAG
jgi:hypothetical protein